MSKRALVASLLALAALAGCNALPGVPGLPGGAPAAGATLQPSQMKDYFPAPAKGQKWTYVVKSKVGSIETPATEFVQEILDLNGDKIKVRVTIAGQGKEEERSIAGLAAGQSAGPTDQPFTVVGNEDVVVPAGSFKAFKLSVPVQGGTPAGTKAFIWVAPGTGMVKQEVESSTPVGASVTTVELKEFKK